MLFLLAIYHQLERFFQKSVNGNLLLAWWDLVRNKINAKPLSRKVFYFWTQIAQIKGIISLALVINIPKIPNICGSFFWTLNSRKERKNFVYSVFSVFKISLCLCASVCRTQSRQVAKCFLFFTFHFSFISLCVFASLRFKSR